MRTWQWSSQDAIFGTSHGMSGLPYRTQHFLVKSRTENRRGERNETEGMGQYVGAHQSRYAGSGQSRQAERRQELQR